MGRDLAEAAMTAQFAANRADLAAKVVSAKTRVVAWCRILDAVAEMRESLDHRIWREDPDDTHLEADVRTWCELARALADFLKARRAA
jgi:hypothetical protein